MNTSTKKSAISSSVAKPEFDPNSVLANLMLSEKLNQLFDDFERPARMILQRNGLNAQHETACLVEWLERRLRTIRGEDASHALIHQAFG